MLENLADLEQVALGRSLELSELRIKHLLPHCGITIRKVAALSLFMIPPRIPLLQVVRPAGCLKNRRTSSLLNLLARQINLLLAGHYNVAPMVNFSLPKIAVTMGKIGRMQRDNNSQIG